MLKVNTYFNIFAYMRIDVIWYSLGVRVFAWVNIPETSEVYNYTVRLLISRRLV